MLASCTPFASSRLTGFSPYSRPVATRDSATRATSTPASLGMSASELQFCCRVDSQIRCQSLSGAGRCPSRPDLACRAYPLLLAAALCP